MLPFYPIAFAYLECNACLSYAVIVFASRCYSEKVDIAKLMASFTFLHFGLDCQVNRTFSRPVDGSLTDSDCGYNCSVTYVCNPGYTTGVGNAYNAACSAVGVMEPPELCVLGKLFLFFNTHKTIVFVFSCTFIFLSRESDQNYNELS